MEPWSVLWNTVYISALKIITGLFFTVIVALLLNEVGKNWFKRTVQTSIFLPYFISWVILAGMMIDMLSPNTGVFSGIFNFLGMETPFFLGDNRWFPTVLVISDLWKGAGYGVVVYLAAITSVDPSLYEAATIDGAGHFKRAIHVTLPGITPVVILMTVLSLGNILNAGFEQVFNLYSDIVLESGDILDTFIYRMGIQQGMYSMSTAVGLFKSVISFVFIAVSYLIASKKYDYKIF